MAPGARRADPRRAGPPVRRAGRRAEPLARSRRRRALRHRPHRPTVGAADGPQPAATDPGDGDLVHPDHRRAVVPAHGARHPTDATEPGADQSRPVPHVLRDDADAGTVLRRGYPPADRGQNRRDAGVRAGRPAGADVHDRARARAGPGAVRRDGTAPGRRRRSAAVGADSGVHGERTAPRLRDRLPGRAVPDHRHGGGFGADVDGHDDAAAGVKIIFFVLVDGWSLVVASLVRSFGT